MDQVWEEYLAATGRLDAVRREAVTTAAERQAAVQAARGELAQVRERLALQQREWPGLGVPITRLQHPVAPETVGAGPAEILSALRHARSMVDEADALVMSPPAGPARLPPPLRNLLVYAPLALLVLIAQLVVVSFVDETPFYLPLIGLVMPAVAFGLGFLTIGLVFPAQPGAQPGGGRLDRTPILGAAVCLASVLLLYAGIGALALVR